MILIVDDNHENLFSLKTLLHLHEYGVETAMSGEEALKKVLKTEYALIILDVQMPGMDGYEVAEAISGLSKTRDIPIIFLSAVHIDKWFITKGYDAGAVDYVTKPFDPDLLMLKVKTFYRLSQQTRAMKAMQAELKEEVEMRRQAQDELQQANAELEDKVSARTMELMKMNKALQESNAELQQYAFVASHDLQEPLRKVMTFSQMIGDRYLSYLPEAKDYLQRIISSTGRMRSLIDDLLQFSRISGTAAYESTDLQKVVENTLDDLELLIHDKNATITVSALPVIDAIPGQMQPVFQNLLNNALKFSRSGVKPTITVNAEFTSELELDAPATDDGKFVRIYVQDNGIGFKEMYLEKIFTMFQRLHGRIEYEGTGIGLAIVKKIIDKHHGLLTAKSIEGEGTTFIVMLPVRQSHTHSNGNGLQG
jgi:signal transduction histidine kinase